MRILYLDVNATISNPTPSLILAMLCQIGELNLFGPGYVEPSVLQAGLTRFIEKHGPYDYVIANEHTIFSSLKDNGMYNYYLIPDLYDQFYSSTTNLGPSIPYLKTMLRDFVVYDGAPKLLFLMVSDYYTYNSEQLDILEQSSAYIVGWGKQFVKSIDDLPNLSKETFGKNATDNWFNYVTAMESRIISMPAFVGYNEFDRTPLSCREFDWVVPGVGYWARKEALEIIKTAGKVTIKNNWWRLFYSGLSKLGFKPYSYEFLQKAYNQLYCQSIKSSRFAFACGSGLEYPVRKYFEIPALGSLLVCLPCAGCGELGLIDGENAIICPPEQMADVITDLHNRSDEELQVIASRGRDLIWSRHSLNHRAIQISDCLEAVKNGTYSGNYWDSGELYLLQN